MNTNLHIRQRGVSLIEALVALAVMAIGMLGLMGVQTTLRSTSDVAMQRSEAVRIAQEEIERWRGYTALTGGGVGITNFTDLTTPDAPIEIAGRSATFTLTRTVTDLAAVGSDMPVTPGKSVLVTVTWVDRNSEAHSVYLATLVAGLSPELQGTLAIPGEGDIVSRPQGRKRGIPLQAKDLGNGTSGFIPPNAPTGTVWVFDNVTGLITLCTTSVTITDDLTAANVTCTDDPLLNRAVLVSGFVRYALDAVQPAASAASAPSSAPETPPASNYVNMWYLNPSHWLTPLPCYTGHFNPGTPGAVTFYSAYYCAVPVLVIPGVPPAWTGSLKLGTSTAAEDPLLYASSAATPTASLLRVCRYGGTPASYSVQSEPLANQNFLVIRAGDDTSAFTCPAPPPNPLPVPPPVYTVPHYPAA